MKFGAGWTCGVTAMVIFALIQSWDEPTEKQIGHTYQQLKEMKAECEKDLPRSTECSITVYYLPQAEQLEEVE
jgi:hypothetical protein